MQCNGDYAEIEWGLQQLKDSISLKQWLLNGDS